MDYFKNYFSISVLTVFIFTTICSGAPTTAIQDISQQDEGNGEDPTDALQVTSTVIKGVTSASTSEGDIVITASVTGDQNPSSDDMPEGSINSVTNTEADGDSTASLTPQDTSTELPPASTEHDEASTVTDTEKEPSDVSTQGESSSKTSNPEVSTAEKPASSSSNHKHNAASTVVPHKSFILFLVVLLTKACLLKS